MQLSFDPRDRNAATAALAVVLALHPDIGTFDGKPLGELLDDDNLPDPATAFAGGASAQDAFGAAPLAAAGSPAPSPANAGTSHTAAPAGESAPAAAASSGTTTSSNGPTAATTSGASPSDTGNGASAAAAPSGGNGAGAASPNPGNVEVDANGLPWDGRIHSGPADKKPRNGDNTWRKKRGVSDDEVAAVEAEMRAALNAPAAGATPPPPPAPIVPVAPASEAPAAPVPPSPPAAPVPASPPPAPVAAAPAPAPAAPAPTPPAAGTASGPAVATTANSGPATTFAELMKKITGLQTAGHLTVEGTAEISQALGISGVRDLITRPDLVPSFDALLPGVA